MPTKYRKLHPAQLARFAREITAAARALIETANQKRTESGKAKAKELPAIEWHHLGSEARELNLAVRAVVALTDPIREELFIASKELRKASRLQRKAKPKCGAYKASGGRCGTRLEPGQFRCPIHALERRMRRRARAKTGGGEPGTGGGHVG